MNTSINSTLLDSTMNELNHSISQHPLHNEEAEVHRQAAPILFLFACFLFGSCIRYLMKKWDISLPYTVILFVSGVIFGLLSNRYQYLKRFTTVANINPKLLLHIFLPVLIFESAFAMNAHVFFKCFAQCVLLAVPGLIICATLIAVMSMNLSFSEHWDWHSSFLFGAILSATDPVAVVALLKDLGTSELLSTLIDGEALLNDGSAIVIYEVLLEMLVPGRQMTGLDVFGMFCRFSIGGPILGLVLGKLTVFYLIRVYNDAVVEITLTISSAYLTYYLAEMVFGVSGVLAVVALGIVVSANKTAISPEMERYVHSFWEMMTYFANTVIFVIVGVIIAEHAILFIDKNDIFLMFVTYISVTVFRLLMIGMLSPILKRLEYGLTWINAVIMTWGGLRGAVGLALALSVSKNPYLKHEAVGEKILIHVSGIVVLTLLVNATTTKRLIKLLGADNVSSWKRANMWNAVRHLKDVQERVVQLARTDSFLSDSDWKYVRRYTEIHDPFYIEAQKIEEKRVAKLSKNGSAISIGKITSETTNQTEHFALDSLCVDCSHQHMCLPSKQEQETMFNEARLRFINAQKTNFWRQFELGLLLRQSVAVLVREADDISDKPGRFITVDDLRSYWEISGIFAWLKKRVAEPLRRYAGDVEFSLVSGHVKPPAESGWRRWCYNLLDHLALRYVVSFLLLFDICCSITELALRIQDATSVTAFYLRMINVIFVAFYAAHFALKLIGLGIGGALKQSWGKLDAIALLVSLVSVAIEITMQLMPRFDTPYVVILRFVRVVRFLHRRRAFMVIAPIAVQFSEWVYKIINERLTAGYDIGRGFEMAQIQVSKVFPQMINYKPVAGSFQRICHESRLEIVRELATLQALYPDIATAVKTRRAAQHVLNNSRDQLDELKHAGFLDDIVYTKLHEEIERKMMNLQHSVPTSIQPTPVTNLLMNIPWIGYSNQVYEFFKASAQVVHFSAGSVLFQQNDHDDNVYLITFAGIYYFQSTVAEKWKSIKLDSPNFFGQAITRENEKGVYSEDDSKTTFNVKDLLTVGCVIGEIGFLTNNLNKDATAKCETDLKLLKISNIMLVNAMQKFESIELLMWRSVALKVAKGILDKQQNFQHWRPDKLMLHLEKSHIPDLRQNESYMIRASADDVILIQGKVKDEHSNVEFIGPCILPSGVMNLRFQRSSKRNHEVILVIVAETNDDVESVHLSGDLVLLPNRKLSAHFNRCLLHDIRQQERLSLRKKKISSQLSCPSPGVAEPVFVKKRHTSVPDGKQLNNFTITEVIPESDQTDVFTEETKSTSAGEAAKIEVDCVAHENSRI